MFNVTICDDEPLFLEEISKLLNEILSKKSIAYSLVSFNNDNDLLSYFEKNMNDCDLLLLDILISKDKGIEIASRLRKLGYKGNMIIVTSSTEYLLESYQVEPLSYILKPIDEEKFEEALIRAYKKKMQKTLVIQTPSTIQTIPFDDILYIEIYNKTLTIHTIDNNIELMMSLSSIHKKLPSDEFIQCHRGYIVAFKAILSLKRYEITLKNHKKIPVSKYYYKAVQAGLLKWAQ